MHFNGVLRILSVPGLIVLRLNRNEVRGTAITKGETPVPVCSPKLSPVGRG